MDILLSTPYENLLLILFMVAMIAGIVDAIAGGGGLITIPAMLILGVSPITALGTNRMQAVIGELTACVSFVRHGVMQFNYLLTGVLATSVGALIGTYCVSLISNDSLQILLPILMVGISIYSVLSKSLKKTTDTKPILANRDFMIMCGLLIGFYNGFFGPGTGSIWMVCFVMLLGITIKKASIATKPLNLAGNFVSLLFFIVLGNVDFTLGAVMGLGQIIGSIVGSRLVVYKGDTIVRPVFITMTLGMTFKLLYENAVNGNFELLSQL